MKKVRRALLLTGAVFATATAVAPAASAAPANILAGDPLAVGPAQLRFNPSTYAHDGGTVATMTWLCCGVHNVISTQTGPGGQPLFKSGDLSSAGTTPVNGTEFLPAGSYDFICSYHYPNPPPGMSGRLNVTAKPASVAVEIRSKDIDRVARSGKLALRLTTSSAASVELQGRVGGKGIGRATVATETGAGVLSNLKLKLSNAGADLLEGRKKATVRVTASIATGESSTAKKALK